VLTVEDQPVSVERRLAAGDLCCPGCGGRLARWGFGVARAVRGLGDSGLSGGKPQSALARNAAMLGARLGDLDAVVISHLHADHVGGLQAMRRRTFAFAAEPLEPRGVPAAA